MTSLKKDLKKICSDILGKQGIPVFTDKSFNAMWDAFAKTQPSTLNTSTKFEADIWGSLQKNLEKFIMKPEHASLVIPKVKKIYGDDPAPADRKSWMC